MFGRYTERAQKVLVLAEKEARRFQHNYIGTEHLLLGLIQEGQGVAAKVLESMGISNEKVRQSVEKYVGAMARSDVAEVSLTPRSKKVLSLAIEEARQLNHNYIGTEHLLLGLIREGEGIAARVITELGGSLDGIRSEVIKQLGGTEIEGEAVKRKKSKTPTLDEFSRDLTEQAIQEKLDPVIGRAKEIERVIQILSRRTKNNPVLIGEPGVGKTAIAEGLAQRIVQNNVPEILLKKRVVLLDLSALVAGSKYRGEFEKRMKAVMEEIRKAGDIIIFIDELHTLVGAGAAEGAIDAANILKPALARGEMQCIGATTLNEYRKYIEKDTALERRFQSIIVEESTPEETREILEGLRDNYEAHHRVKYTDEALASAVTLSHRYISDRYLPDKAIDLIDEAGSKVRLKDNTRPPEMKEVEEKLLKVEQEKEAAIRAQEFEKAAKMRDQERQVKEELQKLREDWEKQKGSTELLVEVEDIAKIVSQWTGIPVTKLQTAETEKLVNLEQELHKRVIGQDEAVNAVAKAIRRARAGLKDPKRPIGSFIFLGPTGVGKTELARSLAQTMFNDEDAMIRLDMSEYMEKHTVSRLIGSPPGYVGYDDGGQLTEKVRRRPFAVVLFDEIEKAHQDVFNILLQVFEDGQLTDSHGRKVDFKNTVIIMTSNVGATTIEKQGNVGFKALDEKQSEKESYESMKNKVLEELKKTFRPEFLNRLDETIVFHSLNKSHIKEIIELMLAELNERLSHQQINLEVTEAAKNYLIENGYDSQFGARPLRRSIQKYLENPLADDFLRGNFSEGDDIVADVKDEKIDFSKKES